MHDSTPKRMTSTKTRVLPCLALLSLLAATGTAMSATPSTSTPTQAAQAKTETSQSAASGVESDSGRAKIDDAVAVRDTLAGQPAAKGDSHSITERIREFAHEHLGKHESGGMSTGFDLDKTFAFAVPAPHGVLYRSSTHQLSINASLAGEDDPDLIELHRSITGPRGRKLVIAPDAKAKGYIQTIDLIELDADGKKTSARGRVKLSPEDFAKADGNFAILLICTLKPPYLTDLHEHSDPTDEEPTDITTRTSTLHASVNAVWLINQKDGTVLAKGLRLAK